jgi:restriction endonuclease
MKLRFDSDQEHQVRAVESVVRLFDGQPRAQPEMAFAAGAGLAAVPNRLDLSEDRLLANLNAVQRENALSQDVALESIQEEVETAEGMQRVRFANFSVEMETGTGKTYVYLRTALELYRRYGQRRFIVVVPSVAIREGVMKTLRITRDHFARLFENLPYRFAVYDSANLTQVRQFALSDGVEILVMTIDSFKRDATVMRRSTDRLSGETPIHLVQATRPILILDEPQNMESEKSVRALAALHPLLALRYSATHRNPYNVVYQLTPYEAYRQGLVKRIEVAGIERETGDADREVIFEAQIRYTIEAHLRRQRALDEAGAGVKVLTLFFVDRVASYADEDGIVRTLFDRIWNELRGEHPRFAELEAEEVREAYFAQRTTRAGETIYEESRTGEAKRDQEAYDLIMRDKERLLDLDEPVSFIFSHSALREGWDNPNVFQICTLNQSVSEVRKRQEIGRGVRLAVNQEGVRVRDPELNVLLVVANESYERYVAAYQSELEEEFGREGLPPAPGNARRKTTVRRKKEHELSPEFRELWERIRQKTRYAVRIDTERLVREVVEALDSVKIGEPGISITRARVDVKKDEDRRYWLSPVTLAEARRPRESDAPDIPDVTARVQEVLEHVSPPIRVTRRTVNRIYRETSNREAALRNPHGFATVAAAIIRDLLADQLVDGIEYEPIEDCYEMHQFALEVERFREHLIPATKSIYDHVEVDTAARDAATSIEGKFVAELEASPAVKCYVKLPRWFTVETPVGAYNPDWALVMARTDEHGEATGEESLYLVSETKGEKWQEPGGLSEEERRKIRCAARHFGSEQLGEAGALEGVDYRVGSSLSEIRQPASTGR